MIAINDQLMMMGTDLKSVPIPLSHCAIPFAIPL